MIRPAITSVLRERIRQLEEVPAVQNAETISTGFAILDQVLPDRGFRRGSLIEWLTPASCGAGVLSLIAAVRACRDRGPLLVIDRRGWFCPWPAFAAGVLPQDLIVVHPQSDADQRWALDQALRCPAVGAILAWPDRLDGHTFRRLKLAAETSGALGCLVRPASARDHPTWADVRLLVRPKPGWQVEVKILRCRGHQGDGAAVVLDLGHASHPLRLASELADPTASRFAARA